MLKLSENIIGYIVKDQEDAENIPENEKLEIASEGTEGKIILQDIEADKVVMKPKSKESEVELGGEKDTTIGTLIVESSAKIVSNEETKITNIIITGEEQKPTLENLEITGTLKVEGYVI